jgi:Gram-negative bacterial TonB protein C-terminal
MIPTRVVAPRVRLACVRRPVVLAGFAIGVLVASGGVRPLPAQMPNDYQPEPRPDLPVHRATVALAHGWFTVTRQAGEQVHVVVRTDSGTFAVTGDSASLADWADSSAALPDLPPVGAHQKVSFRIWQLRAQGDTNARMRMARVPTNHGPDVALALFNGAWGIVEYLGPQSDSVLSALRGTITDAPIGGDALELGRAVRIGERDTSDVLSLHPADSTSRVTEKQARQLPGPHPMYPMAMLNDRREGEVLFQFVIDTTGRAEMPTLRLLKSTNPQFALACRQALPNLTFVPAEADGHKVRELVQLPFDFKLR